MTQILNRDKQGLIFEIISARISEQLDDKKYVIYTLQVRFVSESLSLKQSFPSLMANVAFPKKVLTGNFDNELISARSTAFESVLKHIANESKLRTSRAMQMFLQEPELTEAKKLFDEELYASSVDMLRNIFKLLNKVFSDRSHAVLLILCRLVAYCAKVPYLLAPLSPLQWADLALYRFDGVSDSDFLELYVPLLFACRTIYQESDKDTKGLETQLKSLKKQGVKGFGEKNLLEVLNELEEKLSNQ